MEHEVFIIAINVGDLNVPGLVAYSNGGSHRAAEENDGGWESGGKVMLSELEDLEEELADLGLAEEVTLGTYSAGPQCSSGPADAPTAVENLPEATDPSGEAPPRAA